MQAGKSSLDESAVEVDPPGPHAESRVEVHALASRAERRMRGCGPSP